MTITVYSFEGDGASDSFTTQDATEARRHGEQYNLKVIAHDYELSDSEVAWDFTPGPKDGDTDTCRFCLGDIEYDSDNAPPWTHTDTGFSDCPLEDGEPTGNHAEPTE